MKKKTIINLIKTVCFVTLTVLMVSALNFVLRNKNEANLIYPYYYEKPDSLDTVFVGSSHVMCGVFPDLLEKEYGIKSYDFTSSALVLPQAYYQVIEALKTQSPRVLVLDVSGAVYENTKVGSPEYVHVQLDNMKWSLNRINAINDLIKKEDRIEYWFPFYKFHTRWKELEDSDYEPITGDTRGAYISEGVLEVRTEPVVIPESRTEPMSEYAESYLRKILDYCKKKGVPVLMLNTPTISTEREQACCNAVNAVADEYGLPYLNLMYKLEDMGFDFRTDMRDEYHCNLSGGSKITRFVGKYLSENYDFE